MFFWFVAAEQVQNLTKAMDQFHKHTCIRWVPRTDEDFYVKFIRGWGWVLKKIFHFSLFQWRVLRKNNPLRKSKSIVSFKILLTPISPYFSCSSLVGRIVLSGAPLRNGQPIKLENWCFETIGTLMHEMMHTLGFFHEQSRLDRDNYLLIDSRWIRHGKYYHLYRPRKGSGSAHYTISSPFRAIHNFNAESIPECPYRLPLTILAPILAASIKHNPSFLGHLRDEMI